MSSMDDIRAANAIRKLCPTLELSDSVAIESGKLLKQNLRKIIRTARVFARNSKRVLLNTEDINYALGIHGFESIYGSQRFHDQRLTFIEEKNVFFAQDADIGTQQVNTVSLPRPPASIHIHSHWLSVEGKQPQLPENESLETTQSQQKNNSLSNNPKDSANKKRKNMNTVHSVFGGMKQGGVELRLPVEHALTTEQQAYFDKIHKLIEPVTQEKELDVPKQQILQTIDGLQSDAALQPLVPYLIRFASQQVSENMNSLWKIELTLRMLNSLVKNSYLELGVYCHHLLPLILSCLLSESVGNSDVNTFSEVHKLRCLAGKVLSTAISAFDDSISNLYCRICQKLSDCFDPEKPFSVQYGAVQGLNALGATHIPAVERLLKDCLSYLSEQIPKLPTASDESKEATACLSFITEIIHNTNSIKKEEEEEECERIMSPLQKRARREQVFF